MIKRQKIVCKGNVGAKMAAAGVTAEHLQVTTLDLTSASFLPALQELALSMASTVRTALQGATLGNGETLADTLELPTQNGEGFIDLYVDQMVSDIMATAIGTASQGRARKAQLVQCGIVPDMAHWSSDGKEKVVVAQDDAFAGLTV